MHFWRKKFWRRIIAPQFNTYFLASWTTWSSWSACTEIATDTCVHSRGRNCQNGQMGALECPVEGANQEAPCSCDCNGNQLPRQVDGASENETGNGIGKLTINFFIIFAIIIFN